jgi:hypothetical protein
MYWSVRRAVSVEEPHVAMELEPEVDILGC